MGLNEGAICLANTLAKPYIYMNENTNKEKLTQKINFIQSSISKYNKHSENYKNNPNLSEEDKKTLNLGRWYHSNRKSYHSDKYNTSKIDKNLLDDLKKDPYYILKNSVEIIGKQLVSKLFENSLKGTLNNVKVYTATDIDDIKGGVDLIVVLNEKGEKSYVGIDIAVSDNQDYLSVKNTKQESVCQEFNLYKGLYINTKIRRMVLDFERIIMADLLIEYLDFIEKGIEVNILELYDNIYKKRHNEKKDYEALGFNTISRETIKKTNKILAINPLN